MRPLREVAEGIIMETLINNFRIQHPENARITIKNGCFSVDGEDRNFVSRNCRISFHEDFNDVQCHSTDDAPFFLARRRNDGVSLTENCSSFTETLPLVASRQTIDGVEYLLPDPKSFIQALQILSGNICRTFRRDRADENWFCTRKGAPKGKMFEFSRVSERWELVSSDKYDSDLYWENKYS